MNLGVATRTATIHQSGIRFDTSGQISPGLQFVRVTSRAMALLAQKRSGTCQQHFVVGAVWGMTIQAVFPNRGVLENKRSTLFSVALEADFIDCICFQKGIGAAAMWIMAINATYFTLE